MLDPRPPHDSQDAAEAGPRPLSTQGPQAGSPLDQARPQAGNPLQTAPPKQALSTRQGSLQAAPPLI